MDNEDCWVDELLVDEFSRFCSSEIHEAANIIHVYRLNQELYSKVSSENDLDKARDIRNRFLVVENTMRRYILECKIEKPIPLCKFMNSSICPLIMYKRSRNEQRVSKSN